MKIIETHYASRVDVSAPARQKTEAIPELASAGYVQKFRRSTADKQRDTCARTIADIRQEAKEAAALPPLKK